MKKLLATLSVVLLSTCFAFGQNGSITGMVTDATTGETLPGVNVFIKSLNKGAATDADGNFTINDVPYGTYDIRISYIGYKAKTIALTVDQETVAVNETLSQSTAEVGELIVTALGIERQERSLGYSVQEVEGQELSQTKETNFVSSLTGKIAGANISSSNAMGGSARIVLRGSKSIIGNNQPLFVVDGVPLDNSNFTETVVGGNLSVIGQIRGGGGYDFGNAASVIDPYNVKSVSILKGPSAAALYGSRARNGVIEITTKNGAGTEGLGITINSGVQFSQVYNLPEYQNKYGGGANAPFEMQNSQLFVDYGTDESWGPRLDGRMVRQWYSFDDVNGLLGQETPWVAHPNNVENFFRTGVALNNNVSLSKGAENYSYRLSLTRIDNKGVYPESELSRKQVGFNGRADFSDKLTGSISVNYSYEDARARPGTGYDNENVFLQFNHFGQRQVDLGPDSYMADYARPDGSQRGWNWFGIENAKKGIIHFTDNPYWIQNRNYEKDDTQRLYGKVAITYDFTDYLNLTGNVRTDIYTERREQRVAQTSQAISFYQENIYEIQETNARLTLNFSRVLNEDFNLEVLAGGNIRYNNLNRNIGQTQGGLISRGIYTLENSTSRPFIDDFFQQKRVNSFFANTTLGYQDMLYLSGSIRNDWSSTLPEDNNSYLYPSVSGSFVFTELAGMRDSDVVSYGKIRLSYAQTGNDTNPYQLATTFPLGSPFGDQPQISVPTTLNNAELKPEITSSWEVGTQLEFFNNRTSLDVTYYNSITRDQIIPINVSQASGYARQIINAGKISNRGLEISASVTPLQMDNGLRWDISANWAKNINKIEELAPGLDNVLLGNAPFNVSINARVGESYGVIVGTNYTYDENGNKVVNPNGTYKIDTEQQVLGSYVPDWTGGISTSLTYKGFTASVSIDGQKGGDVYSITNAFGRYSGITKLSAKGDIREVGLIAEGVQADGSTNTVRADPENFFKSLFNLDAANVYDAGYIKLREVRMAYNLPVTWFKNTPFQGITVSAVGRNLATLFRNTPNVDPINVISTSNLQGIEAGAIPPQRSYGFNIKLDL